MVDGWICENRGCDVAQALAVVGGRGYQNNTSMVDRLGTAPTTSTALESTPSICSSIPVYGYSIKRRDDGTNDVDVMLHSD